MTREEWCGRLRAAREAAGWSQNSAAKAMGVATPTYRPYEIDAVPTVIKLYEMIETLHLDTSILFPEFAAPEKISKKSRGAR